MAADKCGGFECGQCKHKFKHKSSFKRHQRGVCQPVTQQRKFSCSYCTKSYSQKHHLQRHINNKHDNNVQKTTQDVNPPINTQWSCQFCQQNFTEKCSLQRHIHELHNQSSNEWLWECDRCSRNFKRREHLQRHRNVCIRSDGTTKRIKEPTNELWSCQECHQTFTEKCSLQRHINEIHEQRTKGVSWACDQCQRTFKRREHLETHKTRCMYEICEECGEGVTSLKQHIDEKHNGKFTCSNCGRTWRNKYKYDKHVSRACYPTKRMKNDTHRTVKYKYSFGCGHTNDQRMKTTPTLPIITQRNGFKFMDLATV